VILRPNADAFLEMPDGLAPPQSTVDWPYWAWSDSRIIGWLHRGGAGLIRRLVPSRHREGVLRRFRLALHRGSRVECPICSSRFRHFMSRWNGENVVCWRCESHERHRALWLFLEQQRPDLRANANSLLHFAPEPGIEELLRARVPGYVSSDIDPDIGELTLDLMALDLPDASFDATICSHVLEHVPDDAAAMGELHRVLTPGGFAIVMVPISREIAETIEDPGIEDPVERRKLLLQEDHMRLYGLDIVDRLGAVGFAVDHVRPSDRMSEEARERYRLGGGTDVFVCFKPTS
jgi:Methyltransferase domain